VSDVHAYTPIELQDLLDNRLPEPRRSEVAAHAADCAICQRELGTLSLARRSVGALPDDGAPRALRDRVLAAWTHRSRSLPAAAGLRRIDAGSGFGRRLTLRRLLSSCSSSWTIGQ
jgi:anti-sigma factor RsiW